jgi:hypothetical protein
MDNNTPMQTPKKDLMNSALEHYEEASSAIHHHMSDIPKAIKEYYRKASYTAVFETSEYIREPESNIYDGKSMEEMLQMVSSLPINFGKKQKQFKLFVEQELSEETFKFIENIANIEKDFYGEKTYVINAIKFRIVKNE